MAAGKPIVARRVGALPDTVLHGATGLLLEGEDAGSVAAAIGGLLRDRERARAMGEAARRRAREAFSPERHAARVEAIYREVLARRRPP
jgi:glycosyltransferase involved in cell wall biosynthesis